MHQVTGVLRAMCMALLLLLPLAAIVQAQSQQDPAATQTQPKIEKRQLLVPPRNADGSPVTTAFSDDPVEWVKEKQREFYGALSGALRQLKTGAPVAAAWTLLLLSFAYGIFHAAGPGHGKAVVSAWLLATESELKRGVLIAFMSAFVQALSAIAIVSVVLLLFSSVGSTARDAAGFMESASYALIGAMGLWLIWSGLKPHRHAPASAHDHDHHHHHGHHHHHDHVHDESCGHSHVPEAKDVKGDWSLLKAASLSFAVGIRPCTGAILALIFANSIGLYWAGVVSTFAMALGTFITVSVIAALAVYSKKLALRLASSDSRLLGRAVAGLKLGGGAAIAGLGALLFWGSLGTTNAMM